MLSHSEKVRIVEKMCAYIPHAEHQGICLERIEGEQITLPLPGFTKPHGGCCLSKDAPVVPKIINFSLDYLRPARLRETRARCELTRQGRFIANISITAWQEQHDRAVATARAHFIIPETDPKE